MRFDERTFVRPQLPVDPDELNDYPPWRCEVCGPRWSAEVFAHRAYELPLCGKCGREATENEQQGDK